MAVFETESERLAAEIESARDAVRRAQIALSNGRGSVDAVNKADRRLADAHDAAYEWRGGYVPTNR